MRQVQVLEHAGRNTGAGEGLEEALGAQRRLVRSFKHHRVARYQRRQHRIDGRQVGVVPRSHGHDQPQRHPLDLALKSGLVAGLHRGERLGRDVEHIPRAFFEAADLAGRMTDGTPHLPGDFGGDVVCLGDEGIDGLAQNPAAVRQR